MSDNVNYDMQFAPFEENVDFIDWAALEDEVVQEPWLQSEGYDWTGCGSVDQGAEALPGVGAAFQALPTIRYTYMPPTLDENPTLDPAFEALAAPQPISGLLPASTARKGSTGSTREPLTCDFEGCKAKPFKRRNELDRHKLKHDSQLKRYSCSAIGCTRRGLKGFYRMDKLMDHRVAGHTTDDLFECGYATCKKILPRDLMAAHHIYGWTALKLTRSCPIMKCSFRTKPFRTQFPLELDDLQSHLRTVHEARSRENCADRISARGYHAASVNVICPVCVGQPQFQTHTDFYRHFVDTHFHGPTLASLPTARIDYQRFIYFSSGLDQCTFVPDEVRQHRRTLLSLWPAFESYPVWDDIKKCT